MARVTTVSRRSLVDKMTFFGSRTWLGWGMAITAIVAYSLNAPLGRGAMLWGVNPTLLLIIRFVLSTAVATITFLFTKREILKIGRRGLLLCALLGGLGTFTTLCFYWGLSRINVSIASMIVSTYPLVVLVGLALRGEKITKRNMLRLIFGLGGVYFLIGPSGAADSVGVLLMVGTILGYAVYLILAQWYMQDYNTRAVAFYTDAFMALFMTLFALTQNVEFMLPAWPAFSFIIVMAIVGTFLSRNMLYAAIRRIGSGQVSLLSPLDTMLTVTWSILFLHEHLIPIQWLGAALILISMLLVFENQPKWRRLRWRRLPIQTAKGTESVS